MNRKHLSEGRALDSVTDLRIPIAGVFFLCIAYLMEKK